MNIRSVKQLIKNAAEKAIPVPIMMIGAMGVGKSQIVAQVAKELKIGFTTSATGTRRLNWYSSSSCKKE